MDCPSTLRFESFLTDLSPEQADKLLQALQQGQIVDHLRSHGIEISACDSTQLIQMIRRRMLTVTDDDLALVAGGEIKVTAAIVGAGASAVAVVAGGIAVATTLH